MAVHLLLFSLLAVCSFGSLSIGNCNGGKDTIEDLPGYVGPELKMNSGFIEVNQTANGRYTAHCHSLFPFSSSINTIIDLHDDSNRLYYSMFYWLVHSMNAKADTPLLIWLNGGPGASSLTALFAENGPFRINTEKLSLHFFNATWAKYYHMLFIDNPIGTGFSYCNNGSEVQDEDQMGYNFAMMMKGFYDCHPELKTNDLYITGTRPMKYGESENRFCLCPHQNAISLYMTLKMTFSDIHIIGDIPNR